MLTQILMLKKQKEEEKAQKRGKKSSSLFSNKTKSKMKQISNC